MEARLGGSEYTWAGLAAVPWNRWGNPPLWVLGRIARLIGRFDPGGEPPQEDFCVNVMLCGVLKSGASGAVVLVRRGAV